MIMTSLVSLVRPVSLVAPVRLVTPDSLWLVLGLGLVLEPEKPLKPLDNVTQLRLYRRHTHKCVQS